MVLLFFAMWTANVALGLALLFAPSAGSNASYASGAFRVEISGVEAGYVADFEAPRKGRNTVKLSVEMLAMPSPLLRWVTRSLAGKAKAQSATIRSASGKGQHTLAGMHIAEISFPALDGSSKDPAYFSIKLRPERVSAERGGAVKARGPATAKVDTRPNEFTLTIGGLPTGRVAKIDSFSWKQAVVDSAPTKRSVSDIKVHVGAQDHDAWKAAIGSTVSRNGTIIVTDGARSCTVGLRGVKIKAVKAPGKAKTFQAALSVQGLGLRCG